MEKLITQNGGYKVYVKLEQVQDSSNNFALSFVTEWDDAKTVEKHQKFIMFLNSEQKKILKDIF